MMKTVVMIDNGKGGSLSFQLAPPVIPVVEGDIPRTMVRIHQVRSGADESWDFDATEVIAAFTIIGKANTVLTEVREAGLV